MLWWAQNTKTSRRCYWSCLTFTVLHLIQYNHRQYLFSTLHSSYGRCYFLQECSRRHIEKNRSFLGNVGCMRCCVSTSLLENYCSHSSTALQPTQCIHLDVSATASFNINDGRGKACKNKSCIIPEEIHNMKYLVLFYLTETLKEKKHAAQMHTCFFLPWFHWGLLPGVLLSACSTWPVCDKGMWRAKEKKKKLLKLYLASWRSPVSRQQTSYEIRRF